MAVVSLAASSAEALLLGLATGPVCLASCGPVVLPWMLVQPKGVKAHGRQLLLFLAARLAGYLVFAMAVWLLGANLARGWSERAWSERAWSEGSWIAGVIQLLLAIALLAYAAGWPHPRCLATRHKAELVQLGEAPHPTSNGALALGFLTGINLCPPFVVAGVRTVQLASLTGSLLFFFCFFLGTTIWFAPFVSLGMIRRTPEFVTVARVAAILLACWYGFSGVFTLMARSVYG